MYDTYISHQKNATLLMNSRARNDLADQIHRVDKNKSNFEGRYTYAALIN